MAAPGEREIAVITGGAGGIGWAGALSLGSLGDRVALLDLRSVPDFGAFAARGIEARAQGGCPGRRFASGGEGRRERQVGSGLVSGARGGHLPACPCPRNAPGAVARGPRGQPHRHVPLLPSVRPRHTRLGQRENRQLRVGAGTPRRCAGMPPHMGAHHPRQRRDPRARRYGHASARARPRGNPTAPRQSPSAASGCPRMWREPWPSS